MNAPDQLVRPFEWPAIGPSRVPFPAYTDPALYREELERFFYRGHWCYAGLEAEVPEPGDFKRTRVGERSVILVRGLDGAINVVENRCAHRGAEFCQQEHGRVKDFICPYHQWSYDLAGNLLGVPFRRGVRRDGRVEGGMPPDFKLEERSLVKLKVETYNGVVFASFDHSVPPLAEYFGPEVMPWLRRVFNGRKLHVLGYSRQRIPGNWKLMQENIKDPYHAGLLHVFFVTFGLFRADQKSATEVDDQHGRHGILISRKGEQEKNDVTADMRNFQGDLTLNDPRILDVVKEFPGDETVGMITVFPSVILQQQVNSLTTRQIIPKGPGGFDFVWTHFGYADDTEEMRIRRTRQANLFGPAGFVSADDGEIIEFSQQGLAAYPQSDALTLMDGRGTDSVPHMVTEVAIRGMYRYWRQVMGIDAAEPSAAISGAADA